MIKLVSFSYGYTKDKMDQRSCAHTSTLMEKISAGKMVVCEHNGYFTDLDGYYWEVAYGEAWEFGEGNMLVIEDV